MNFKSTCLSIFLSVLLLSCTSTTFYQIYKVDVGNLKTTDNEVFYEDESCVVYYDFWSDGGTVSFKFYNKSEENIYLDLRESFFIKNGIAYDYFRNQEYSKSDVSGFNSAVSLSWGNGTSTSKNATSIKGHTIVEKDTKEITIPPKAAKIVAIYSVNTTLFKQCNVKLYPRAKEVTPSQFVTSNSPFNFSNIITYKVGKSGDIKKISNLFFVSEIVNKPYEMVVGETKKDQCGKEQESSHDYFLSAKPNMFYIKYSQIEK